MSKPKPNRNLWPASIVGFFVLAIIFMTTFVIWAMRQREDLVSADYYEREVRYQQQLDTMNRSHTQATQVVVTFELAQQSVVVTLPSTPGATGRVYFYRPSDARQDRELPLALNVDGVQHFDAKEMATGFWKVRVKWTANGQDYFLDQPVIVTGS